MLADGRHTLGPDTGTLQVRTSREGAYAKAGHDLVMDVMGWDGVLDVAGDAVSLQLTCDPRSLRVRWGFNGATSLSDKDRSDISNTIDSKVLRGAPIRFRSSAVRSRGDALLITGDLEIGSATSTISFELRTSPDGTRADAVAIVTQSDFGMKPYSAMLGTLKVRDAVEIVARATLPRWTPPATVAVVEQEPARPSTPEPEPEPAMAAQQPAHVTAASDDVAAPPPYALPVAAAPQQEQVAAAPAPSAGGLRLRWPR